MIKNYSSQNLMEKLRMLQKEDFVWIIYIGIIIFSFYSNNLERKYFIYNDLKSKEKYRESLIMIFSILLVIYIYFLKSSIKDINDLKPTDSLEKKRLVYLSFLGSLLIAISGFLFLYISFRDENIDVEIAFN